ncbi:hypothetical protein BZL39_C06110 [Zygosaccharomyces parabailii]|nr:hypothetical protein BZL39_C06110 [Zygosaccharomyces parabailii]
MYYLDQERSEIVWLDNSSLSPTFKITKVGRPDGIQVDREAGKIYWTDMGSMRVGNIYPSNDGSINSINFDGTDRVQLVGNGLVHTPKQLKLDKQSEKLYWCDREGGKVMSCRTDGSGLEILVERSHNDPYPKNVLDRCVGICIDTEQGFLYWTQKGPSKAGLGRIFMCKLNGNEGESANARTDITVLAKNLPEPIDLELDSSKEYLYWTDRGVSPKGNSLNRARIVDMKLKDHEILCNGFEEAIGLTFNESYTKIFVSDLSGKLYEYDLDSKKLRVIYDNAEAITGICL